ncbi:DsbA family protein [Mycolicibacterium arenosum]|uniref:DsbA family protein n=1 Tax=Mycolicibacterium arenosum TaxID=2952157 RepID=A0ABT1LW76_9MYCO|nr:thioredoxin domain-containing protein [Mycolicibacterium sp. CAU 1645]MCP9270600.1 DsbA family protein [Mycolicibacterium sp. CAU 1645]
MHVRNRLIVTVSVILIAAVATVLFVLNRSGPEREALPATEAGEAGQLVRENSRRLNTVPGSDVTFVEFLDFECEGCRAMYPAIEQLRSEYGDRVNFVIRYFPLSGHFNGERAARAVEAAAQQDQLEAMYSTMFETQGQWGEQRVPADATFRRFAVDLGLDMAAFDAAYDDPATVDRIRLDMADGRALGVTGTPTLFVNGERLSPRSYEDLTSALDARLEK